MSNSATVSAPDHAIGLTALIVGCDLEATGILQNLLDILGWTVAVRDHLPDTPCAPKQLLLIGHWPLIAPAVARLGRDWAKLVIVTPRQENHDVSRLPDNVFLLSTPVDILAAEQMIVATHPGAAPSPAP